MLMASIYRGRCDGMRSYDMMGACQPGTSEGSGSERRERAQPGE
jgi:hypothetical protein